MPAKPGAWLMATAKHRAIDTFRRAERLERKTAELGRELTEAEEPDWAAALDEVVEDDVLRLVFISCHPVLSREARVALTLRLIGGLSTDEIARAFLVGEATVAQRIVRAKRTLTAARVPFELPAGPEFTARLSLGARGDLPGLQRGLRGDRPVRTGCARRCARRRCGWAASSPS